MMDNFVKGLLVGVGLAIRTKDMVEEWAGKFVQESRMNEDEGRSFINDLVKQSDDARKNFSDMIDERVEEALDGIGAARKSEIEPLRKRIGDLEREVASLRAEILTMQSVSPGTTSASAGPAPAR